MVAFHDSICKVARVLHMARLICTVFDSLFINWTIILVLIKYLHIHWAMSHFFALDYQRYSQLFLADIATRIKVILLPGLSWSFTTLKSNCSITIQLPSKFINFFEIDLVQNAVSMILHTLTPYQLAISSSDWSAYQFLLILRVLMWCECNHEESYRWLRQIGYITTVSQAMLRSLSMPMTTCDGNHALTSVVSWQPPFSANYYPT